MDSRRSTISLAQRPFERFVPALEQSYLDVVDTLLAHGVSVDAPVKPGTPLAPTMPENQYEGQSSGIRGRPLERLISVSAFHEGHFEAARLLVLAGAQITTAARRLEDRLDDPGPGGFGFSNRPQARRILRLLKAKR